MSQNSDTMKQKEINKSQTFRFEDSIEYAEAAIVSKTIIKRPKGNVSLFAFDKDEELSEHTAPFDALVQVVEGTADIIINGQSNILNAGQSIVMPANIPHALKATERFKMVLTMIKE